MANISVSSIHMHVRPYTTSVWVCSTTDNMSFLDIKDPAERATLVKEYVTAMKTVTQRNMANRELKLVNVTKQAAEETRKQLEPMKKTLAGIDGAVQRATPLEEGKSASKPRAYNHTDRTFGFYRREDGHLGMGDKVVVDGDYLYVEGETYHLTPGLQALITHKRPEREDYDDDDFTAYRALVSQTNAKTSTHLSGVVNPYHTWK